MAITSSIARVYAFEETSGGLIPLKDMYSMGRIGRRFGGPAQFVTHTSVVTTWRFSGLGLHLHFTCIVTIHALSGLSKRAMVRLDAA